MMQEQCTAELGRAKKLPCCAVLLCNIASQHDCATADIPIEICSSHMCADMQEQSTAALGRAKLCNNALHESESR